MGFKKRSKPASAPPTREHTPPPAEKEEPPVTPEKRWTNKLGAGVKELLKLFGPEMVDFGAARSPRKNSASDHSPTRPAAVETNDKKRRREAEKTPEDASRRKTRRQERSPEPKDPPPPVDKSKADNNSGAGSRRKRPLRGQERRRGGRDDSDSDEVSGGSGDESQNNNNTNAQATTRSTRNQATGRVETATVEPDTAVPRSGRREGRADRAARRGEKVEDVKEIKEEEAPAAAPAPVKTEKVEPEKGPVEPVRKASNDGQKPFAKVTPMESDCDPGTHALEVAGTVNGPSAWDYWSGIIKSERDVAEARSSTHPYPTLLHGVVATPALDTTLKNALGSGSTLSGQDSKALQALFAALGNHSKYTSAIHRTKPISGAEGSIRLGQSLVACICALHDMEEEKGPGDKEVKAVRSTLQQRISAVLAVASIPVVIDVVDTCRNILFNIELELTDTNQRYLSPSRKAIVQSAMRRRGLEVWSALVRVCAYTLAGLSEGNKKLPPAIPDECRAFLDEYDTSSAKWKATMDSYTADFEVVLKESSLGFVACADALAKVVKDMMANHHEAHEFLKTSLQKTAMGMEERGMGYLLGTAADTKAFMKVCGESLDETFENMNASVTDVAAVVGDMLSAMAPLKLSGANDAVAKLRQCKKNLTTLL